jgi:serine/threonine-protein kinase
MLAHPEELSPLSSQHLSYELMEGYVDGRLTEEQQDTIRLHLLRCKKCAEELENLQGFATKCEVFQELPFQSAQPASLIRQPEAVTDEPRPSDAERDAWYRDRRPELESDSADQNAPSIFDVRRMRPWAAAVAAVFIVMLSVGAYLARNNSLFQSHSAPPKIHLVVIPFVNLSADPDQEYFSAGLTDEMITRLRTLDPQRLGVIASATSTSKALEAMPISEIGRALDVQYALEGRVRRDGNHVRIDVQLTQLSDQTHLWADSFDRDLNDILRVQDDVGAAVASQIRRALNRPSGKDTGTVAERTVNPDAYDDYLHGRVYWKYSGNLHKSIEAYELAIQKDPQYAPAYAALAGGYASLGNAPYDDAPPIEAEPKAREAAEHALQLDPQLAEAHDVLAYVAFNYEWDFARAESEFQRALALNSNNPTPTLWYGHYCIARNRVSQALEENFRLLEIDPISPLFNTGRAEIYYYQRKYDEAIDQARRTIKQYPTYWLAYIWLGSAYREKKRYLEALEQFSRGRQLSGDQPALIALYGHALAMSGDAAGARKTLAKLQGLAQSRYVPPLYFAAIYLGLGETSTALDWLDRAYKDRNDRLVYLGVDPIADPLRGDPRFAQLLHKIGIK